MLAYRYEENTKAFEYALECDEDVLDGGYILPASSTFTPIPKYKEYEIPVYNIETDSWSISADYRNQIIFNIDTQDFIEYTKLGELPENCILVSKELEEQYYEDPDKFKVVNNEIVDISGTPEYAEIKLNEAKEAKCRDNDTVRDARLVGGITYKEILFDSDTDQKVNLREQIDRMSDTDTVIWFGMNNDILECTKEDLLAIGNLIIELTEYVWTHNAELKAQIMAATTIEEVNQIEIEY